MVRSSVQFLGNRELARILAKGGSDIVPMLGQALFEEAHLGMRESQAIVPFRFGHLKGSKRVFLPDVTGTSVEVWMGYGGAARKYAKPLHDNKGGYYSFRNGKRDHYLSDPVEARAEGLDKRLLKRIDRIMKRG